MPFPGINIDLLYINRKVFKRPIVWTNSLLKTPYIFRDNHNKLVKFDPKTNTLYDGCTEYFRMKSRYIHSVWSPLLSARQWALCVLYFVHLSTFEKIMFWRKMENSRYVIRNSQFPFTLWSVHILCKSITSIESY